MWRWFGVAVLVTVAIVATVGRAQAPELELPRPGIVVVADVTGEAEVIAGEQRRKLRADDRVRVGANVATARRSMVTLVFSNGASVQLGSDTEIEIEEFGQEPYAGSFKFAELKTEPSRSRTRIRLVRGDVVVMVKPLKVARGSSFSLTTPAGVLRTGEGAFRTLVQMHDLGLGVATLELKSGAAEFEVLGSTAFVPVPVGQKLAFALEVDKNGVVKVGEMPKETAKGK